MAALGFFAAALVMQRHFASRGLPRQLAWSIVGYSIFGGLLGARLFYVGEHWPHIQHDVPGIVFVLRYGGMSWYGGVLGGMLAAFLPAWLFGVSWPVVADGMAVGAPLGLAFGRLGCHLAGDGCRGVPTRLPWGVAYTAGVSTWPYPRGVLVHPTALYELAASVIVFATIVSLRSRLRPDGALAATWFVLGALVRFLVDFVRDSPPLFLGLTEAQCFSILAMAGGAIWLARHAALARIAASPA